MMSDYIYIVNYEIIPSGRVREKVFLSKEEYIEFKNNIVKSSRYNLLEAYVLDMEEVRNKKPGKTLRDLLLSEETWEVK